MLYYKRMYFTLYNRVTDAILELQEAQRDLEEMFMNSEECEDDEDDEA